MLRIRAGVLTFLGTGTQGYIVEPKGFTGWASAPGTKGQTVARPDHGDFDLPVFKTARIVTIAGNALARSDVELQVMGSRLTGLGGSGQLLRMTVAMDGRWTWADGRVVNEVQWPEIYPGQKVAEFQVQFKFANPRKYGQTQMAGPGTTVLGEHRGNFPASPVLTVAGSMAAGYTINGPAGKAFVVTQAVVTGHPHTIDMATGLLSIDGATVYGAVAQGDLWTIPGGTSVSMTLVPTSGAGTLASAVKDTFI